MQYKTIKFKNGDVVSCGVDDKLKLETLHEYEFITIKDPVLYGTFKFVNQLGQVIETVSMGPYIPTSSDEEVVIPADSILTICNIRPGALDRYLGFIDSLHKEQSGLLDNNSENMSLPDSDEIWDAMEEAVHAKVH
jgi:hypothetical protein